MKHLALDWSDSSGDTAATIQDLEVVFESIVEVLLGFAGIALFIMLIIGGFKYITSAGNPDNVASARSTITIAIAGLVLVLLALLILNFIENFTGLNITEFNIFVK